MNTVVMDIVRIGVAAVVFIIAGKLLTQFVPIPGLTQVFGAV